MTGTGLIHIYCGDGKGKTTAAVGQAVRAAGCGHRVLVFQFLKDNASSERNILKDVNNITLIQGKPHEKFVFQMSDSEKQEASLYYKDKLAKLMEQAGNYKVLILDEVLCAVGTGLITEEELLDALDKKPEYLEVVLTGNPLTDRLRKAADYVTEMKKVAHPYDRGQAAREGIEH